MNEAGPAPGSSDGVGPAPGSSDDDLRALADNIPTLCWMANADGWIFWYNPRWYAFTGTTPADMEGWGWQGVHDPEHLPEVLARWQGAIASGDAFAMTFPLRAADGTFRPFLTRAEPIRDGHGRVTRWFGVNIDISEQVAAETALRAERDRSRGILETMREGFLLLDQDFRIRQVNAEGLRLEKRPASELLGRSHWEVYPGTEHGEIGLLYKAALRDGIPVRLDHHYVWPDGHEAWIEMRGYPAPDRSSLAVFYRDVTQARHAQDALRASEEQFRVFAQAMPNHVWAGSADGNLYWFNDQVYAYSGTRPEDLMGAAWTAIVHPDDVDHAARTWMDALARGAVYETEFRIRRADGSYRWFLVRGEPIRALDGSLTGWVGSNTDIHEQKRVAAEMVRLNETLEHRVEERTQERNRLWEATNDLIGTAGLDGYLKAVNPAWTRTLGWTDDELLGRPFLDLIDPADHAATAEVVERLARGERITNFVDHIIRKDGALRTIAWTATPDGDVFYIVGRDLTEQRQAEEQFRQAQKLEAVGQLTGGVAHDFNNLLTVIRSSIDLMRRPDLPEERRRRYIDAISDTVTRAVTLTGQLLAFARRQALQPEVFDAGKGLRAIADMLGTLTGSRIDIRIDAPDAPCLIDADTSQFETAIVNMSVNARDAMRGEGRLTITVRPVPLIPAARAHPAVAGEFVSVAVADTGTGIARDDLDRIFEPFFTTKDVGEGTGLGLSQVFGFAKQSGGEIRVESEVGRGTTFTLYLPRAAREGVAGGRKAEPEGFADGHGSVVLLVEDNAEVGRFAMQALDELGYATVWAANAQEALAAIAADPGRFDVVFSDVVMPGTNGIDLAHAIRRHDHGLPVVLTSGYSHVLARDGTDGFELLNKPYSVEQLSRILSRAAASRRRGRPTDR